MITVVGTGDDGGLLTPTGPGTFTDTTLRGAITTANAMPGPDLISFKIAPGVVTISPHLALPTITDAVVIDGTPPLAAGAVQQVVLSGASAPAGTNGLTITAGDTTVQILTINGFAGGSGILITGPAATNDVVAACFLGTDADGTVAVANFNGVTITGGASNNAVGSLAVSSNVISGNTASGVLLAGAGTTGNQVVNSSIGLNLDETALPNGVAGVLITGGASGNSVGDTTNPETGNIISGNGVSGVQISGTGTTGNRVVNNYLGLNVLGMAAGNGYGVLISGGASGNTVGGTTINAPNVISGNMAIGVRIQDAGTTGNVVAGNFIGTNVDGSAAVPNVVGVQIQGGASGNTVGGTAALARNVISGNSADGVLIKEAGTTGNVVAGNSIGTNAAGAAALPNGTADLPGEGVLILGGASGNTIGGTAASLGNVISGNLGVGVRIDDPGTSANVVAGDFIGTDVSGSLAVPNVVGVVIEKGATDNTVGGTAPGARNVISGNSDKGVQIMDPGTSGNTVAGNYVGTDATGTVALHGSIVGVVVFNGATDNTVGGTAAGARNVISGNDGPGVQLAGAGTSGNVVAGNFIGTDPTGTAAVANATSGVLVDAAASGNTVGGTSAGARNVISGNTGDGVTLEDAGTLGNVVAGNFIGTNADGSHELHNDSGVSLGSGASSNTVGGTAAGAGNLISGNNLVGVILAGAATQHNTVAGNLIGTNFDGTLALGNGGGGGVDLTAGASNNTVGGTTPAARNVISGNLSHGVVIGGPGTSGNVVAGNYVGTNAAGTAALGNGTADAFADGVQIAAGASGNLVGGTDAGAGNVISGNPGAGVGIEGAGTTGNTVAGNHIGTNAAGTAAVGNGFRGVQIAAGASGNLVGGTTAGAGNLISGNGLNGVLITGAGTTGNTVAGNDIGTDVTGTLALGNGFGGVNLDSGASGNTIGGTVAAARNVISGNGALANGVVISAAGTMGNTVAGNFIGTQADGVTALGNGGDGVLITGSAGPNTVGGTDPGSGNVIAHNSKGVVLAGPGGFGTPAGAGNRFLGNRIFANAGPGIDLGDDGATANDPGDGDTGPNNLQNFPVLTSAAGTTVTGTLNSTPGTSFRIELFATPAGGPSGAGQTFLGFTDVTTDAAGNAGFTATVAAVPAGQGVAATATNSTTGDTSEFSSSVTATVPAPAVAPAAVPAVVPAAAPPVLAAAATPTAAAAADVIDVTGRVHLVGRRVQVLGASGLTRVRLLLRNNGSTALTGPVSFVLDRLTRGVRLVSRTGVTVRLAPLRSPWQDVPLGPSNRVRLGPVGSPPPFSGTQFGGAAGFFAPGEVRALLLTFRNPAGGGIRFSFRVLAGPGVR
jgi:hypothetical protein